MTAAPHRIGRLAEIADRFGGVAFDQFGVLHDGESATPGAAAALEELKARGLRLGVVTNSGKRADVNRARLAKMGFAPDLFDTVMSSGEAAWIELREMGAEAPRRMLAIEAETGDAAAWAEGLDLSLTDDPDAADAVLLMGMREDAGARLDRARARGLTVHCTNVDLKRPLGNRVIPAPGALALAYERAGGEVRWHGKPAPSIFHRAATALGLAPGRLAMVGDSLAHDVAGAQGAGWASIFVESGIHAADLPAADLAALARRHGAGPPDHVIERVR